MDEVEKLKIENDILQYRLDEAIKEIAYLSEKVDQEPKIIVKRVVDYDGINKGREGDCTGL